MRWRTTVGPACAASKERPTPLTPIPMSHLQNQGSIELVCIDYLCLELDTSVQGNVLVLITSSAMYIAQAFPMKDQYTVVVTKILVEKLFVHYGLPQCIHSDKCRDFKSKLNQTIA